MIKLWLMLILNLSIQQGFHRFYPTSQRYMDNNTIVNTSVSNDTIVVQATCQSKYGIYTESLDRDHLKLGEDFFGVIVTQNRSKGYFFMVNAKGVKQDGVIVQRATKKSERDFVWIAQTIVLSDTSWECKIKIPLLELDFEAKDSLILFMNFIRSAKLEGTGNYEAGTLVPIKGSNFYDLTFTKKFAFALSSKKALHIMIEPYSAIFKDNGNISLSSGENITLKTGAINTGMTITPEYLTVESDIEQFNLNKSAMLYYPEKRPFFMKDFDAWNALPFQVLYTRRISDIEGGIKINYSTKTFNINTFIVEEGERDSAKVWDKLTYGLRGIYSYKYFDIGGFYLRSRDTFRTKGMDATFYLPLLMRLNIQYTLDRYGKNDLFVHFYRYVRPGINIEGGYEHLDSVSINTAYTPYPLYTASIWLNLMLNFTRDNKIFPYYEFGIGELYGEYLNQKFFENYLNFFATLGILNNLSVVYNIIPWKRYAIWNDTTYNNFLHYLSINYKPKEHHEISVEGQTGKYFGGAQNYYSFEYSYKGKNIQGTLGYGYDSEPFYIQKRFYFKGKWNIKNTLRLRLFAQHSDISNTDKINFLAEYEIIPGTFVYLVVDREDNHKGIPDNRIMLKLKSFFRIL